ncbi:MAG TPA: DUF1552 domain-containing protein [Polyangiaceae bacterium]|nr:DUF1552 domain-containing protein [Polyangiaceae bacterium]
MSTSRERASRRSFLRAVGAGAAALPFFKLLENSAVEAQGATPPLKFVTVYHPHGIAAEYWAMGCRGAMGLPTMSQSACTGTDTETSFDISYANCSLQPFDDAATYGKSFKDKILIVDGIDLLSAANGHDTAGTILTGSRIASDGKKPANSSLDQFLAVEKGLGAMTRLSSIALGVGNDAMESGQTLSYGVGGAPLPKIIDPVQAFDQLFAGFVVTDDPAARAEAARRRLRGQTVVDFLLADVNRLRGRLAQTEQMKLDQHLASLHEIEKQFQDVTAPPGALCMLPGTPDSSRFPKLKQFNGGEPYFDAITDAHIDVLAQALACDLTRFATFLMNDLSYASNPLGLPADNHGSVAHPYNASTIGNDGHRQDGTASSWLPLATFNKYAYSKVARLMKKLDELGALDSTLIYVTSDMGNPALHSTRNVPTVLAGGANGKFRMGRRVRLEADCPTTSEWCGDEQKAQKTNNHLLVSIAQAFDVDVDTFGTQPSAALTTGPLSEIA